MTLVRIIEAPVVHDWPLPERTVLPLRTPPGVLGRELIEPDLPDILASCIEMSLTHRDFGYGWTV